MAKKNLLGLLGGLVLSSTGYITPTASYGQSLVQEPTPISEFYTNEQISRATSRGNTTFFPQGNEKYDGREGFVYRDSPWAEHFCPSRTLAADNIVISSGHLDDRLRDFIRDPVNGCRLDFDEELIRKIFYSDDLSSRTSSSGGYRGGNNSGESSNGTSSGGGYGGY